MAGDLGLEEAAWLDEHLADCPACTSIAAQYAADRLALRALREAAPRAAARPVGADRCRDRAGVGPRHVGGHDATAQPVAAAARCPVGPRGDRGRDRRQHAVRDASAAAPAGRARGAVQGLDDRWRRRQRRHGRGGDAVRRRCRRRSRGSTRTRTGTSAITVRRWTRSAQPKGRPAARPCAGRPAAPRARIRTANDHRVAQRWPGRDGRGRRLRGRPAAAPRSARAHPDTGAEPTETPVPTPMSRASVGAARQRRRLAPARVAASGSPPPSAAVPSAPPSETPGTDTSAGGRPRPRSSRRRAFPRPPSVASQPRHRQ